MVDDLKKQGRRGSKKSGGGRKGRMAGNGGRAPLAHDDGPSFPEVSDARFSSMHNAPVSRDKGYMRTDRKAAKERKGKREGEGEREKETTQRINMF